MRRTRAILDHNTECEEKKVAVGITIKFSDDVIFDRPLGVQFKIIQEKLQPHVLIFSSCIIHVLVLGMCFHKIYKSASDLFM